MSSLGYYPMLALGTAAAIVGYALLSRNPKRSGRIWSSSVALS